MNPRSDTTAVKVCLCSLKLTFRPRGARIQIGVDYPARKQTPRRLIYHLTPLNSPKKSKKCEKLPQAGVEPRSRGPKPNAQPTGLDLLLRFLKVFRPNHFPGLSGLARGFFQTRDGMTDGRTDGRAEKKTAKNAENGSRNSTTKKTITLRVLALFGTDQPPGTCRISIFALDLACVGYFLKTDQCLQSY